MANYSSFPTATPTPMPIPAANNSSPVSASTGSRLTSNSNRSDDPTTSNRYRGFSTSIADLLRVDCGGGAGEGGGECCGSAGSGVGDGANDGIIISSSSDERIDCCSLTCCGILQTDRDRFLLQGVPPPPPLKRCAVHFMLPFTIFLTAGLAAMHVRNPVLNQLASTGLILALILYFVLQCGKGRSKRIEIRKDLLWLKYQLQNRRGLGFVMAGMSSPQSPRNHHALSVLLQNPRPDADADVDVSHGVDSEIEGRGGDPQRISYLLGQGKNDLRASHPWCLVGCYRADNDEEVDRGGSVLARRFRCCGYYPQLCGLCAVAQEGRELERLLPDHYRRIDYITMQPMVEYYPSIYKRKYCGGETAAENGGLTADFGGGSGGTVDSTTSGRLLPPLSKLSLRILHLWFVLSFLMLAWGVVGPLYWKYIVRTGNRSHAFALADFGIYLLTFVEAIAVLLLARLLLIAISRHSSPTIACKPPLELSADAMIKYFASGFLLSTSLAVFWELMGALLLKITVAILLAASGIGIAADPDTDRTMTTIHMATPASRNYHNEGYEYNGHHHHHPTRGGGASFLEPFWWSAEPASSTKDFMQVFGQDHPVIYTFYLLLNAFVLAALIEEVCKYFGYRMVEHPDLMSRWDLERASHVVHASADDEEEEGEGDAGYFEYDDASRSQNSRRQIHFRQQEEVNRKRRAQRSQDYSKQRPSVQATGASMTLAMVSVAMGFTCCENLVYVFLYSSNSPRMELYVLMSRTLFPVHPIAAALQSVGVCRRDLEGAAVSLWRIVLPAVLFHGAYDFFILWVDFLDKRHGVHADEGSEQVSVVAVAVSFVVSVLILLTALVHLWRQGRQQRQRLAEIDRQASHRLSGLL